MEEEQPKAAVAVQDIRVKVIPVAQEMFRMPQLGVEVAQAPPERMVEG